MATGASAFIRLQKPDNEISQGLQFWGNQMNDLGREYRDRNEREKIRRDKELSDWEKENKVNIEDFTAKVTGFSSFDDIGRDAVSNLMSDYIKNHKLAQDSLKNGNLNDKQNYEMDMLKIKNQVKNIKDFTEAIAQRHKEYQEMVDKGEMSGVDFNTWEKEMQSIMKDKNFNITLDNNKNLKLNGIKTLDDGTKEPFSVGFQDAINGSWRAYRKQNLLGKGGIIDNIQNSMGSYETKTQEIRNGVHGIREKLGWDNRVEQGVRTQIGALLQSDEATADLLNQVTQGQSTKRKGFTDDDKNFIIDKITNMMKGTFKAKDEWKVDDKLEGVLNDKGRLNETIRHNKAEEAADKAKLALDWYEANTKRMAEEAKKIKDNPDINVTGNNISKVYDQDSKKTINVPFTTYTLSTANKNKQYFTVGASVNEKGVSEPTFALNVAISKDGRFMKFKDTKNKIHFIDYMNGNIEDKKLYDDIKTQMYGRDINNIESPTFSNQTNVNNQEDLRNKYGY